MLMFLIVSWLVFLGLIRVNLHLCIIINFINVYTIYKIFLLKYSPYDLVHFIIEADDLVLDVLVLLHPLRLQPEVPELIVATSLHVNLHPPILRIIIIILNILRYISVMMLVSLVTPTFSIKKKNSH